MYQKNKIELHPLTTIAPCDGRYLDKTDKLNLLFSEFGLIHKRVEVEVAWIKTLSSIQDLKEFPPLSKTAIQQLDAIVDQFDLSEAEAVKAIEARTRHDVKAVEYYLRERFKAYSELSAIQHFIHFACTSEDINNLAWRLIVQEARDTVLVPHYERIHGLLDTFSKQYAGLAMLARTHGQVASPTTLGKEFANVAVRLQRQIKQLSDTPILSKWNGAVGNFNAHKIACPDIDWISVSEDFIRSLNLEPNLYTTQIEPNDTLAEILHNMTRINRILTDLAQDVWLYIAFDLIQQKINEDEVGSSTMPHKVNPIDFENAEGNFGIANANALHLASKITVSRLQRDLTDSTSLRTLGLTFAHTLIALHALEQGLGKIIPNVEKIEAELSQHWEVLSEAVQTVMRLYHIPDAYEQMKKLTRGQAFSREMLHTFIATLDIPQEARQRLLNLTPKLYTGLAQQLANKS